MKQIASILIIALLTLLALPQLSAQKSPMKWGKVDEADLEMTVYPQDSSADAVVLADYGHLRFDFTRQGINYIFNRHRRIKILQRSGFSQGDIRIPYYGEDRIAGLKAQVINPDGSKESLKNRDIFDEEISESFHAKKFSFPNLQEGSIVEYEYELYSPHYFQLEEWYFQEDIPVRWSEYRLEIPEWFNYVVLQQGRHFDVNETSLQPRSIYFPGVGTVELEVQMRRYVMEHLPALKEESYVTTMDDYLARIQFQLSSYQLPNSILEPVLSTWPDVAKELINHAQFGQQYHRRNNFKSIAEDLEPLISQANNQREKVEIIYQSLANEVKWNGTYSYMASDDLDRCYELKEANSGELNLMLIALLKEHDINAYPLLVSTRSHGKMLQLYPILSQFNHVLALVEIGDKLNFLDVSSPYCPMGFPRIEALNGMCWLVDETEAQWIQFAPPSTSEKTMAQIKITTEGHLQGKLGKQIEGYSAINHREHLQDDEKGAFIQKDLVERFPDIQVESISIENAADVDEPLKEQIDFTLPNGAHKAGDFLYLSPALLSGFTENPLKAETRLYPVNIPYPTTRQQVWMFDIPDGYTVEELPEELNLALPNQGGIFLYSVNHMNGKLQINSRIQLTQLVFEPQEYQVIKSFFDMIIEKQEEQVVLKKKT